MGLKVIFIFICCSSRFIVASSLHWTVLIVQWKYIYECVTWATPFSFFMHATTQERKFYYVGQLVAMSLAQGGSGFPFFAPSVFKYLKGDSIYGISVPVCEVPDMEVRAVLEKVQSSISCLQLCVHVCIFMLMHLLDHIGEEC